MRSLIKQIGYLIIVMSIPNLTLSFFLNDFTQNIGFLLSGSWGIFLGLNLLFEVSKNTKYFRCYKLFLKLSIIYAILNLTIAFLFVFLNNNFNLEITSYIIGIIMTVFLAIIGFTKPSKNVVRAFQLIE